MMASPLNVANFLLHMFQEKKCQVSTVKGYISAFLNTLKLKSGQNIGSDPIISELIKSMKLQRPVQSLKLQNGTFTAFFHLYVAKALNLCIGHLGSISP